MVIWGMVYYCYIHTININKVVFIHETVIKSSKPIASYLESDPQAPDDLIKGCTHRTAEGESKLAPDSKPGWSTEDNRGITMKNGELPSGKLTWLWKMAIYSEFSH